MGADSAGRAHSGSDDHAREDEDVQQAGFNTPALEFLIAKRYLRERDDGHCHSGDQDHHRAHHRTTEQEAWGDRENNLHGYGTHTRNTHYGIVERRPQADRSIKVLTVSGSSHVSPGGYSIRWHLCGSRRLHYENYLDEEDEKSETEQGLITRRSGAAGGTVVDLGATAPRLQEDRETTHRPNGCK